MKTDKGEVRQRMLQAIEHIQVVLGDTQAQSNHLKGRGDVDWDCYNKSNWDSMSGELKSAIKLLKACARPSRQYAKEKETEIQK